VLAFDHETHFLAGSFLDSSGSGHYVWDAATGKRLKRLPLPKIDLSMGLPAVAFNGENFVRLTPGAPVAIEVYRRSDWSRIQAFEPPAKDGGAIGQHIAVAPGGALVVTDRGVYVNTLRAPLCEDILLFGPSLFPSGSEGFVSIAQFNIQTAIVTKRGCYDATTIMGDNKGNIVFWEGIADTVAAPNGKDMVSAGLDRSGLRVVRWEYAPPEGTMKALRTQARAIEMYRGGFEQKGVETMRAFLDANPRDASKLGFSIDSVLSSGMPVSLIGRWYLNSMTGGHGNLDLLKVIDQVETDRFNVLPFFAVWALRAGHPDTAAQAVDLYRSHPPKNPFSQHANNIKLIELSILAARQGADAAYSEMLDWVSGLDQRQRINVLGEIDSPAFALLHVDRRKLAFILEVDESKLPAAPAQPTPQPFWNLSGQLVQPGQTAGVEAAGASSAEQASEDQVEGILLD
jgi:hypothetical protein